MGNLIDIDNMAICLILIPIRMIHYEKGIKQYLHQKEKTCKVRSNNILANIKELLLSDEEEI